MGEMCRPWAPAMCCLGSLTLATIAWAQGEAPEGAPGRVLVSAPRPAAEITGFGDVPLGSVPMQVDVTTAEQMRNLGIRRLSDVSRIDASVGDGFNTPGYWDFLSVRGFVLDNALNYRRDGLPIEAKTSIPLDNKSAIEVLKGISGMQAGIASPGGLVNLRVKRPTDGAVRDVFVGWQQDASVLASADLGERFGAQREFGVRFNAAYEHLDPQVRVASGYRYLLALALDWRAGDGTLLEAEIENSQRSQPYVPGFSALGDSVPAPGDPNINLNNQSWSQPSVYGATTGSLRWTQALNAQWQSVVHAASQLLRNDERAAYPLTCAAERRFDRYCSNGTYDMFDYRSEDQRRRVNVVDLGLNAKLQAGGVNHALDFGVQYNDASTTLQRQAFNYAGTGNVEGTLTVPPAPARVQESTVQPALGRSLLSRCHRLRRAHHRVGRVALHAPKLQQRAHRRQPGGELRSDLHLAVAGAQPSARRGHPRLRQLGCRLRTRLRAEPAALYQPRPGARGLAQPAVRTRRQGRLERLGRRAVDHGRLRHRAAGQRRCPAACCPTAARACATAASATAASRPG